MSIDQFSAYAPRRSIWDMLNFTRKAQQPTGPKAAENMAAGKPNYMAGKAMQGKKPFMERPVFGGFNKGDMLMAGLGMLSARDLQGGLGNVANVAGYAIDRNKGERERADRMGLLTRAIQADDPKKQQEALMTAFPEDVGGMLAGRAFAPPAPKEYEFDIAPDGTQIRRELTSGTVDVIGEPGQYAKPEGPVKREVKQIGDRMYSVNPYDPTDKIEMGPAPQRGGPAYPSGGVQSTFVDADGNLQMVMRDGSISGSGMEVQNPYQIVDIGGVKTAIDRRSGQTFALNTPEEAGRNEATVKTIVANEEDRRLGQRDLPDGYLTFAKMEDTVNQLLEHPGFSSRYGMTSYIPAIRGTDGAGAQALINQISGQTFLQSFQQLKGGGPITDIEGQKATEAATRLANQGLTDAEARKAAADFLYWARLSLQNDTKKAGAAYAPLGADAPALVFNPETMEFE